MNDLLIHLFLAMSKIRSLDLMQGMHLAGELLFPLQLLSDGLQKLLDVPVLGVVFVPLFIVVMVVGAFLCLAIAVLLVVGSLLLETACTNLTPVLAHAMALLWQLRYALGGV